MGKGGGCVPSNQQEAPLGRQSRPRPHRLRRPRRHRHRLRLCPRSCLRRHPRSHHLLRLHQNFHHLLLHVRPRRWKKGVDGIEGVLYRVPETLSQDVLDQMNAPEKNATVPVITTEELVEADGVMFGFPTRYGGMAAQMKAFWDSTGKLWREQSCGEVGGVFHQYREAGKRPLRKSTSLS